MCQNQIERGEANYDVNSSYLCSHMYFCVYRHQHRIGSIDSIHFYYAEIFFTRAVDDVLLAEND